MYTHVSIVGYGIISNNNNGVWCLICFERSLVALDLVDIYWNKPHRSPDPSLLWEENDVLILP